MGQPRYLALDDGPATRTQADTALVGVLTRGAATVEAVIVDRITVDGFEATEKVVEMARRLPGVGPDVVLIDGIAFAGLNMVDLEHVAEALGRPTLGITRTRPERDRMRAAIDKTQEAARRHAMFPNEPPVAVSVGDGNLYVQPAGVPPDSSLVDLLRDAMAQGTKPEPLRLAHHLATAIERGVSGTRA